MQTPKDIKSILRKTLRAQRKALSMAEQDANAKALLNTLGTQSVFLHSHAIAFYYANDGEIDPQYLLEYALGLQKKCFFPRLDPEKKQLSFHKYAEDCPFIANAYGILEPPENADKIEARDLDLVLVPLVGFDLSGNRLGRGLGYYDRSFAFLKSQDRPQPRLIGLGLELQAQTRLPVEPWDIRLSGIATEKRFIALDKN